MVELAYQKTKNFDKLTFLYLITGNLEKLTKMLNIAKARKDTSGQYQIALLLGDVEERVRILEECGQVSLAYLTAKTHGLDEETERIESEHSSSRQFPEMPKESFLLNPPPPIIECDESWPLLAVSKGIFDGALLAKHGKQSGNITSATDVIHIDDSDLGGGWGDYDVNLEGGANNEDGEENDNGWGSAKENDEDNGWDVDDEDLDLPEIEASDLVAAHNQAGFVAPARGVSQTQNWLSQSKQPIDHFLAGSFESAFRLLNEKYGITNFEPLKPFVLKLYSKSKVSYQGLSYLPSLLVHPSRSAGESQKTLDSNKKSQPVQLPLVVNKLTTLITQLQQAYQLTTQAKFSEAVDRFRQLLFGTLFVITDNQNDQAELKQLVDICREYILGLSLELERKSLSKDVPNRLRRNCEMAAYFTHCNLQPIHSILTLRAAMNLFFKQNYFQNAKSFASRLLELGPKADVVEMARKVQVASDKAIKEGKCEKETELDYSALNPFQICASSYKPIYRGKSSVSCGFCSTSYMPEFKEQLCTVCKLAKVGLL